MVRLRDRAGASRALAGLPPCRSVPRARCRMQQPVIRWCAPRRDAGCRKLARSPVHRAPHRIADTRDCRHAGVPAGWRSRQRGGQLADAQQIAGPGVARKAVDPKVVGFASGQDARKHQHRKAIADGGVLARPDNINHVLK